MQASDDAAIALVVCAARARLDDAGVARLRALAAGGVDWQRVARLARHHGLAPLLFQHLDAGARDLLPADVREAWKARFTRNAARNLMTVAQLHGLLELLAGGGIEAMPYKGPALAAMLYGNLALREYVDLDLMVRARDVPAASALLSAEGFTPHFALAGPRLSAHIRLSYVQLFQRADHCAVELHWSVAPRFFALPLDLEAMWSRRRRTPLAGRAVLAPAADDLLLMLAAHGAKDAWERLEWVAAIGEVTRDPSLDWARAVASARAVGGERILLVALALARSLAGARPPDDVGRRIDGDRPTLRLAAAIERSLLGAEPPSESIGMLARAAFHLSLRERLRDRARYCTRLALTTTADDWAAAPLPEALSFLHPAVRALRLTRKYLLGRGRSLPPAAPGHSG